MSEDKSSQVDGSTQELAKPVQDQGSQATNHRDEAQEEIKRLQEQIKTNTAEREGFEKRLQLQESELAELRQKLAAATKGNESLDELRAALAKASELLRDKDAVCNSQELKNKALLNQVSSLKEVVALTKDMLNIRNMEVEHLQRDVNAMEERIKGERERYAEAVKKMQLATRLNADVKAEYEKQVALFNDLKQKYEEKVQLLIKENARLRENAAAENEDFVDAHEDLNGSA
ncbi:intermediate filament protein ifa-1 [Schistocerca nitens]|uniref:intermediate filament protein ifa-1 n=1 Tax=Schistocerca nitens TaxID=7011 RepID=UPI0021195A28|nr:intermediate filament protein ifa-1 [Schistocerca nitens]